MGCFNRSKLRFPALSLRRHTPLSNPMPKFALYHQHARKESDALLIKSLTSTSPLQPRRGPSLRIWESHHSNRFWLLYQRHGVDDAQLEPLWLLRKTVDQSMNDFDDKEIRGKPLAIIKQILDLYTQLIGQDKLEPVDTVAIAKLLMSMQQRQSDSMRQLLTKYVDIFAMDYVRKLLPPHASASFYLLNFYRTTRQLGVAAKFWTWLRQQEDIYLNGNLYGEAVMLMSDLDFPLHVCESVHDEGKERCSHKEIECLLRPGTILPKEFHRLPNFNIDPQLTTHIHNARLNRNDWQTAYLTLDTAFTVWPTKLPTWFLKNVVKTRPIHEAYQVFILYCQHGGIIRSKDFSILLDGITRAGKPGGNHNVNMSLARASWEAIKAGIETDSIRLDLRHLSCLFRGILNILPQRTIANSHIYRATDMTATDLISDLADWFHSHGVPPDISSYNTAIWMGGKLRNIHLLQWALDSIENVNLSLGDVSHICLMIAAGHLEAPEMLKLAWNGILASIEPDQTQWDFFGWAAKKTGILLYYQQQVRSFIAKGSISGNLAKPAIYYLKARDHQALGVSHFDEDTDRAIQEFLKDIGAALKRLRQRKKVDPKKIAALRQSVWQWPSAVPEKWQRSLYDDISSQATEPLSKNSPFLPATLKTHSSTGLRFDWLSYNSWKCINSLLLQAAAFQKGGERSKMDRSVVLIEAKTSHAKFRDGSMRPDHLKLLLDHMENIEEEKTKQYSEQEWREKILDLRRFSFEAPELEPEAEAQVP